jgi:hypothetical protein
MLQQPGSLLLHQLSDHVAEDRTHSIKALVGGADVVEAVVVEQDLLDDKDGYRLAELGARLHDAQAQRDDLGGEEEVDDLSRVILDKGADDPERGKAEILERP